MAGKFPPQSTHEREIEMMLGLLTSMIEGREATYVSAPITSGERFARWRGQRPDGAATSGPAYEEELQREVVGPNREHARAIMRELRRSFEGVLIDPTAVADFDGWTQDDYRHLWARVIESYAQRVVCLDGWQFSNGCAYEFLTAHRAGVETLCEDRQPLTLEEGQRLLRAAIAQMSAWGMQTEFLDQVVEALAKTQSAEEAWATETGRR